MSLVGESRLLEKGLWDGVVDTVGGESLTKILAQTNPGGSCCSLWKCWRN